MRAMPLYDGCWRRALGLPWVFPDFWHAWGFFLLSTDFFFLPPADKSKKTSFFLEKSL